MPRSFVLMAIAVALLAGCGSPQPQPQPGGPRTVALQPCDDGGSGGVLIDGVCL